VEILRKTIAFLKDAKKELKKVHWPDRNKVYETTLIVAGCTLVFATYLYLVDIGIAQIFAVIFYN
jgi:preprotein translocase SecE subunit